MPVRHEKRRPLPGARLARGLQKMHLTVILANRRINATRASGSARVPPESGRRCGHRSGVDAANRGSKDNQHGCAEGARSPGHLSCHKPWADTHRFLSADELYRGYHPAPETGAVVVFLHRGKAAAPAMVFQCGPGAGNPATSSVRLIFPVTPKEFNKMSFFCS